MSTLQDRDLDRSFERLDRSEKYRAEKIGYDATRQITALTRKCLPELIANIRNDRAASRGKALWRALKGISDDNLAVRLFMAGASVAGSDRLGCNRDGHKSFQSTALWISRQIAPKCQDRELQAKIGVWGIEMLLDLSGPVFELRNEDFLVLNGELNDFMDEVYVRELVSNGLLSPIFERPVSWTQVNKGGLPSDHWARDGVSLISGHHRKAEAVVRKAIADGKMRRPLNAVNYLQSPAYIINERLLAFMKRVRRPVVEKPAPGEIFWKWSARDRWKEWQEEQAWKADLVAADALVGRRFWTPLHFDFRGRINPIPHFNFQREDHVRALFLFADGAPIGHEGLKWLKAHVARSADGVSWSIPPKPSKLDLAGRIAWTDKNLDLLCKIGRAVLDGADPESIWWALPADDEPYQFLAACAELVEALDKGPEFETKLPVVFDATCSGLQHYSGMLRSEEGRLVNLTKPEPGGERVVLHLDGDVIDAVVEENGPSDFYGVLAVALWMKCWREAPGLCDLMVGPLDRKIVKTPVMSYFYGATRIGMSEQILEIIKKRNKKLPRGEKTPVRTFSVHKVNGISYGKFASIFSLREVNGVSYGHFRDGFLPYMLADALYGLIGENAPKAVGAMNFLRGLAESAASHNESLRWTTPLGFPVVNAYYEPDTKRIGGRRIRRTFVIGDKNEVDRDGAMDAIAANFVHAADAALLQLVALAAEKEGIPMVSVHDCYGTIAPYAARLKEEIIPHEFIRLHRHNLLNDIREATRLNLPKTVKLPKPPGIGDAELEQVAQSFFFVS